MAVFDWKTIDGILEAVADAHGAFIVGRSERAERGRRIIQVFLDTDEGISIAQCAECSRDLAAKLDELNVITEPYELEVSSPGLEKPLKVLRQYKKNVGRRFKVTYWQETEKKLLVGTLSDVQGERLTFANENKEPTTIEFSRIIESLEELPW